MLKKFCYFTSLLWFPKNFLGHQLLWAFIVFMYIRTFTKNFLGGCKVIHRKRETFSPRVISNIWYEKYVSISYTPLQGWWHRCYYTRSRHSWGHCYDIVVITWDWGGAEVKFNNHDVIQVTTFNEHYWYSHVEDYCNSTSSYYN